MAERYDFYVHDNRKVTFNLTEPIMREDSGVTDFVFHIPKILNDLEVSDWQWWFVFVNAKKEKYSIALTLSDDPESPLENNLATYTVDYAMSIKAGSVQFALEAINAGTGGAIDNEWHTLTYETRVKETLQGNQAEYAETESDVISALLEEVRTKVNQLVGGATPEPKNLIADMTDRKKVYLYIGSEPNEHAGHWYYYNGSTWVSGGVYSAGIVDAVPTQGSTNAVQSGGVYSALAGKVDADGEHQVTPQNISGMQFTKTGGTVDGENIFSAEMLFRNGQYVISADGTVSIGSNVSFNAYCVPVEQNSTYVFPECRFVVLATGNTANSPTIRDTLQYATQADTGEATYLFLSYADKPVADITVKKRETSVAYTDFILPDWLVDNLPIPTVVEKPKFKSASGSLSDGSVLIVQGCRNNTRKGERVVFYGNITTFNSIDFGISVSESTINSGVRNTFTIDGTNITYTESQHSTPVVIPHGLTIADNIQIIGEEGADATYTLTVVSDGSLFSHEFNYSQRIIGAPYVSSTGSVITDAKLTWTCTDLDKQIWMFGDSYFAYSPDRWTYYLHEYGYDQNCLLDGFPGEGGVNGRVAFNNLLQYGTPKYAVWCLGMNDGSDSESAPASDWVTARDYFLQYCENNGVTPMFGTIPTVPTINHEQKNAWIRSSGYRYIDFAKAVGASASGVWFNGMLSSDNVHPTEQGARALFARVLLDLPEIMIGGYGAPTAINS